MLGPKCYACSFLLCCATLGTATGQTPPVEKADFGASGAKVLLLYDMEGLTVASGRFVTKRAGVKRLALI